MANNLILKRFYKNIQILFTCFCLSGSLFAQADSSHYDRSTDNINSNQSIELIMDSDLNLLEALEGSSVPYSIRKNLEIVTVTYYGFDNKLHKGQLIVHQTIANEVTEIFEEIRNIKFPIEKVIPLVKYNWSDEESMRDNNTSAFNRRYISGTRILSMHAKGLAIDINPLQNPYIKNDIITPPGAEYNPETRGTIRANSPIVKLFKSKGWSWGGDWTSLKDYQHFQKELK